MKISTFTYGAKVHFGTNIFGQNVEKIKLSNIKIFILERILEYPLHVRRLSTLVKLPMASGCQ